MFAKLVVVMLVMLGLGAHVLTTRQASLQARSELTQAYLRIHKADDDLLRLRSAIAMRVMPESVRGMALAAGVGELAPAIDELPPALALQGLGTLDQMRASMREQLIAFRAEQAAKAARKPAARPAAKPAANQAPRPDVKPTAKPAGKPQGKPDSKPQSKPGPSRIARNDG
jgi:hypothetical protein